MVRWTPLLDSTRLVCCSKREFPNHQVRSLVPRDLELAPTCSKGILRHEKTAALYRAHHCAPRCVLLFADAVLLGFGWLGYLCLFLIAPVLFVALLVAAVKRDWNALRSKLWVLLLSFVIVVVSLGFAVVLNPLVGARNARAIITACEDYNSAHGEWPPSLVRLVPEYLPTVPRSRVSILFSELNNFSYSPDLKGSATLSYYSLPPFGRSYYDFRTTKWRFVD